MMLLFIHLARFNLPLLAKYLTDRLADPVSFPFFFLNLEGLQHLGHFPPWLKYKQIFDSNYNRFTYGWARSFQFLHVGDFYRILPFYVLWLLFLDPAISVSVPFLSFKSLPCQR